MSDDLGNWLSDARSALGVYRGARSGSPVGDVRAGLQGVRLGNNLYNQLTGTPSGASSLGSSLNTGATGALDALGIYSGLQQGGWQGDTQAGASGLQLAGLLSSNPALSTAGGALMVPLDLYNEINSYQSGATGSDAASGAETGAALGSIVPGVGTVIGGVVGGAAGALASLFGPGEKDPETADVQHVIDAVSSNQNNPNVAAQVQDPYLQLAGLMDERSSTLPEYAQYGRQGEQPFTNAMVQQINNAIKANPALAHDPNAVYNQVVAPWVNNMGSGYSNVGQAYTATNQGLLQDMTNQYLSGNAAQDWKAVGGDEPFANIYQGSPITPNEAASTPPPTTGPLPTSGGPRTMLRAKGGNVKEKDVRSRLREIYADSFDRKRNYDDGGGVDYANYTNTVGLFPSQSSNDGGFSSSLAGAQNPYDSLQTDSGGGSPSSSNYWLPQYDPAQAAAAQAYQQAGGTYASNSGNSSDSSGALGGLGSLLGVSSMGQLIQKYGALAPLLAAALGGNKQASAPSTPAGFGAIPSIPTPSYSRPYTQPNLQNWYTYGQGPEQSFFGNNQLPTVPGVSPPSSGGSRQMNTQPAPYMGGPNLGVQLRAEGGSTFSSPQGDSYVNDPGHGDGTSDDIDAKLSGGEYVMDAGTVSMLGNGSNEAGARALDQLRQRVRQHAGKHLVKGKQFMKAKAPEAYLKGGKTK